MNKPEIALGEDEWKKLNAAGIEPEAFDDHSFEDILTALQPDDAREKELRIMFFGEPDESPDQAFGMGEMITGMVTGPTNVVRSFMQAEALIKGMDHLVSKPAWQTLHESAYEVNELLKIPPDVAAFAANQFLNQTSGISAAFDVAKSLQENMMLTGANAAVMTNLQKLNAPIEAFIKPQGDIAALFSSVAGSLLDMDRYKNLGISALTQGLSLNPLEQIYTPGMLESMNAATAFTRMGEANLSSFEWATTGSRYDLSKYRVTSVQTAFLNFTDSYRDVMQSVSMKPNWLYEAPAIAELPARGYYASSQLLRIVSDEEVTVEEIAEETEKATAGQTDYLLEYLPRLDRDLPMMWHGAVYALRSDNPDRIRHFITSLRELFTHVLHILAPNDAFAQWDRDRFYYADDKPTRQGRLLFICRNMSGSDAVFARFMKNDVDSAISLIKMFQGGTHKINSDYSPQELELILIRAELSLRTFLKVEFDINRR